MVFGILRCPFHSGVYKLSTIVPAFHHSGVRNARLFLDGIKVYSVRYDYSDIISVSLF